MPVASELEVAPLAALADVEVAIEAGPWVEALEAVGEPKAAGRRSAAWAVVPMGCHVVVGPLEALGPTECLHQFPTDAHEHR